MKAAAQNLTFQSFEKDAEREFSLLRAAPFSYDIAANTITTPFPGLIGQLLLTPANTAPILSGEITHLFRQAISDQRRLACRDLQWDGARYTITYSLEAFDGQTIWVEETGERVIGAGGKPTLVQGVLRDISEQSLSRREILKDARYDGLTGVHSPDAISEVIRHHRAFTGETDHPSVCLIVTLDNLADINAMYGHQAGDACLKSVADSLISLTPDPHVIGRLSGRRFAILIPHHVWMNNQGNRLDLEAQIFNKPISSSLGTLLLSGSVDAIPVGTDSMDRLLERLKAAPDQAQAAASPRAVSAPDAFSPDDIASILSNDRISLAYQPIVDAVTGEAVHYECLMRLITDDGDQTSAWKLILDAERHGLVHRLDFRAMDIAKTAMDQNPSARLALNISAGTVEHKEARETYLSRLRGLGVKARHLTLELTETLALGDSQIVSEFASQARALGCRFAIDDFGAGHTSFANLMSIEADVIKIDGTFVRDIARHKHKQTFVRLIVDLARTLGVKTVAEMVDNAADAKLLRHLDVDYLQGYYFGYPGSAAN